MADRILLASPELAKPGTAYYDLEAVILLTPRGDRPLTVKIVLAGEGDLTRTIKLDGLEAVAFLQAAGIAPRRVVQWLVANGVNGTVAG